jgi:signal transduction histidine kinase/CheY-like chemotaxis protein
MELAHFAALAAALALVAAMGLIAWLVRERGRLSRELHRTRNVAWDGTSGSRESSLRRELDLQCAQAAERAAELARANDELRRYREDREKADRSKDEFLGILSHELRNPIQAIQTNAFLVRTRTRDIEITRPTQAIERQVDRLTTLVDDLLDVVRVSQKTHLAFETVSLQQVVVGAIEHVQKGADAHRRELGVNLAAEPLFVRADRARLEQAVGNLVHNAIKYSSQQGAVSISVRREDNRALVSVKDRGIGIGQEEMPHLFELFSRGPSARKHSQSGLGIGLHIARELVLSHGGTLEARSEGSGKGSEFIIRVPITADRPLEPPQQETVVPPASDKGLSILVIDDNRDAADSLHDVLEMHGHDVLAAYDGETAIELVRSKTPQVALVDIGMPQVDGYEVARRVGALPGPKPVLVAVTGWGSNTDKQMAKDAGFDYHLTKPLDYDSLAALLATVARRRQLNDAKFS